MIEIVETRSLSSTAALCGRRYLAVPAAAARAAEVARIGVVSRSARLTSAVSRLFLAAIVAVVVARAAYYRRDIGKQRGEV
jgi:hypothetical protein